MALDIYRPIKTVYNVALWVAPWTEEYNPDNVEDTGSLITRATSSPGDFKHLARCKSSRTTVNTETDPEDAYDGLALKRIRNENPKVTTRGQTYEMERQTVLYAAMFNGVANPMSDETIAALEAGTGVQIGGTSNPKVEVCLKEETYDDEQHLLYTRYQYGYIITTGEQVSDGKLSRPTLTFEEEASIHNKIVFSPFYMGTETV